MIVPSVLIDKYTAFSFALSLVILVIASSIFYVNLADNESLLVIHFDIFRGADFFGNKGDVLNILSISVIVWLINLFLANEFYFKERFLSYAFAASTLLFSALILVAVNVIINVN